MPSPSLSQRLLRKSQLKKYLEELGMLTGRVIQSDELSSLEQTAAVRMSLQKIAVNSVVACEIGFSDRKSERFKKFLQSLKNANSSAIYIWTPRTYDCGVLLVPSLESIKFDFDFTINDEGIIAFTTMDLNDSLLIEMFQTSLGAQFLRIETQGVNWARTMY